MKKKLIALLTATACAVPMVSMVGCGGGDDDHQFTILAVKEETVVDYNEMPVFKALNAATGKDVFWKFNTPNQYANNTDPIGTRGIDAIYHAGFSNLDLYNYGRRNRIVAIDQYLDSMPNFKAILNSRPDIWEALKSPDGHIYSLPRIEEMGLKQYPNILFINKVWIEKLIDTNNMPEGVELTKADLKDGLDLYRWEYKAILEKFQALDMDPNIDDANEVPLAFAHGNWQGNESDLIASFGVPENREHKTIVNGQVTFTVEMPEWFEAIQEMNDWFRKGLIRSASLVQDQDTFLARGQDGRYGSFYWWEKETVVRSDLRDNYIIVLPLKDDDGKRYVGVSNELEVEKGECIILGSCKDKAGLLSYFDKFFEPDYSAQLNYGSIEVGAFKAEKENGKLIPNDDHGAQSADDFRMRNAPYGVIYLTDEVWENSVQMESRALLRKDRLAKYITPYTYPGATSIPNLNYTEQQLKDLNNSEMTLNRIGSQMVTWIRAESAPTLAEYNSFISSMQSVLNTIKNINQDGYDRYLAALAGN